MAEREARYGFNTYRVHVNPAMYETATIYVQADSLTVTPSGALILAVEVDPVEDLEEAPDGELRRKQEATGIDLPPVAIFAPGHWHAAILVSDNTHEPMFVQGIQDAQ